MQTKIISGQEFALIRYTNHGAHQATTTWYPTENLAWLRERCDVEFVTESQINLSEVQALAKLDACTEGGAL